MASQTVMQYRSLTSFKVYLKVSTTPLTAALGVERVVQEPGGQWVDPSLQCPLTAVYECSVIEKALYSVWRCCVNG